MEREDRRRRRKRRRKRRKRKMDHWSRELVVRERGEGRRRRRRRRDITYFLTKKLNSVLFLAKLPHQKHVVERTKIKDTKARHDLIRKGGGKEICYGRIHPALPPPP